MMHEQLLPAFIGALVAEGVEPEQIERAVSRTKRIQLGRSMFPDPLSRAFAFEQSDLLKRAVGTKHD